MLWFPLRCQVYSSSQVSQDRSDWRRGGSLNDATLTISSKNYSSWALRGWLMTKFSGLPFLEKVISPDDPAMRAELLLLSSSFLVPCLSHNGIN